MSERPHSTNAIKSLARAGLVIEYRGANIVDITPKGNAMVRALLEVKPPVQTWTVPK
jgi:Mn-dependent DtxR family transcriptional regulator